ncbi:uncharacterized protein G2W53_037123 [Senna tora]|uniref:Uncharacterized protein n=1 Tax=Senna tora TaxID=362788 RepID=A0A834W5F1_9FABA|nr:uncharacterized protein G2W53_037123 [Senna tora]
MGYARVGDTLGSSCPLDARKGELERKGSVKEMTTWSLVASLFVHAYPFSAFTPIGIYVINYHVLAFVYISYHHVLLGIG